MDLGKAAAIAMRVQKAPPSMGAPSNRSSGSLRCPRAPAWSDRVRAGARAVATPTPVQLVLQSVFASEAIESGRCRMLRAGSTASTASDNRRRGSLLAEDALPSSHKTWRSLSLPTPNREVGFILPDPPSGRRPPSAEKVPNWHSSASEAAREGPNREFTTHLARLKRRRQAAEPARGGRRSEQPRALTARPCGIVISSGVLERNPT